MASRYDEAMPQPIVHQFYFQGFKSLPECTQQGGVVRIFGTNWSPPLRMRFERRLQGRKNRHYATLASLRLVLADYNVSAVKIDVLPFEPMDLCGS
jgi:hypothetical protein